MNILSCLADFIYPRVSIISGNRLGDNNSNQYISDEEILLLDKVTEEDFSDLKFKTISEYSFGLFAFRDGDEFSKVIYNLKYGGMKKLGNFLGAILGFELKKYCDENGYTDFDFIVPVPLFKTKVRERGYNQSDFICRGINEVLGIRLLTDLIVRNRYTSTQTKLSREQRIENMKDAFEFNDRYANEIFHRKIILVDDVITTGSTVNEITKVLKKNNCGEIMVCCLAMAR